MIAEALIQQGINVKLHLVGINKMPQLALPSYVIQHGFINQRNPLGLTKIKAIFQDAHFFIMPTQADCTPIVFSEANSFGVPCITNNVGGIGTIIKNGVNGQTFNPRSQVEEYVNFIKDIYSDKDKYLALALSSYNEYEVRLNWTVAGKRIVDLLKDLI